MIIEPGRDANVSGTFDLVNRGVIGRSYGTRELLRNADIDNTDGVLRSVNIGENVYLVGGIADFSVREDATGVILKDLDGWDEFASGNAGDTALVGTMHIGLTNRDDAILRIDPTGVTLAEGWIRNQGSIVNRTPFASSTLTIAEGTTVYGASSGPVGPTSTIGESDRLGVINRGMIRWDGDGLHSHPFAIDPGFDANVDGEWDFVNYGTVWGLGEAIEIRNADVRNYGEMRYEIVIRNCNVENSGSALGAGGGTNSIDFRDSTVYGGALRGYIDLIGNTRIENVHVEGIFSRVHLLGSGAHIAGSIVNDGEFYLTTPLGIAGGGVDVTGSGSFNLKRDALYNLNDLLPNVLTFGAEQHVHGQGSIGTGDSLGLIHYGTLDAESDGFVHVLTIDPGAAANVDGTIDVVNYGTMASTPDATLEIISGRFDNRGTVEARGGTVMIDTESVNFGGLTLAGGTWRADATDAPASLLIHGLVIENAQRDRRTARRRRNPRQRWRRDDPVDAAHDRRERRVDRRPRPHLHARARHDYQRRPHRDRRRQHAPRARAFGRRAARARRHAVLRAQFHHEWARDRRRHRAPRRHARTHRRRRLRSRTRPLLGSDHRRHDHRPLRCDRHRPPGHRHRARRPRPRRMARHPMPRRPRAQRRRRLQRPHRTPQRLGRQHERPQRRRHRRLRRSRRTPQRVGGVQLTVPPRRHERAEHRSRPGCVAAGPPMPLMETGAAVNDARRLTSVNEPNARSGAGERRVR